MPVTDDTERLRRDMSSKLRNDIENGERPKFDRRIYITLPKEKDHKEHVIGEVCYISKSLILFVSLF